MAKATKSQRFDMRIDQEFSDRLDALRRRETDIPTRTDMIKRLVDRAYHRAKSVDTPPPHD